MRHNFIQKLFLYIFSNNEDFGNKLADSLLHIMSLLFCSVLLKIKNKNKNSLLRCCINMK